MSPFEKLLVDLARAEVKFVTVGGVACAFNGHVRATQDIDILVSTEPGNVQRLLEVLQGFGEGHARELSVDDFTLEPGAIRIVEDFPLDIFTIMLDRRFEDLAPHISWWRDGDAPIPFLDAEGLILLKQPSLRERDRLDVLSLRALIDEKTEA